MSTPVAMHAYSRYALAAVALCDVGVGMILIGTVGLGSTTATVRDVVGWILIAHALPAMIQAIVGRLHRFGEEGLLINIGLLVFAVYQILAADNAAQTVATIGQATLVLSAAVASTLLWAQLSARRLARQPEKLRTPRRARQRPAEGLSEPDDTTAAPEPRINRHAPTTVPEDSP